jgi:hypothetical protein
VARCRADEAIHLSGEEPFEVTVKAVVVTPEQIC